MQKNQYYFFYLKFFVKFALRMLKAYNVSAAFRPFDDYGIQ